MLNTRILSLHKLYRILTLLLCYALLGVTLLGAVNYQTHTIRKGDNLYNLAKRYGVTVEDIRNLNNLTSNRLDIGQTLKIRSGEPVADTNIKPSPPPPPAKNSKPAKSEQQSGSDSYTVKKGDILGDIAKRYGMTVTELKKLNNLTGNRIDVGQKLKIKSGSAWSPDKKAPTPEPVQTIILSPAPAKDSGIETYTVIRKDNLGKIAKQFGMTVEELKKLNNLSSNRLDVGQVLRVRSMATPPPEKKPETRIIALTPADTALTTEKKKPAKIVNDEITVETTYKVKRNDNLGKIAKQFGMTVDELKKLNNLTSNRLDVGQELKVRTQTAKPSIKKTAGTPPAVTTLADTSITSITTEKKKSGKTFYEEITVETTYQVKRNDNLSRIAKKYGITAQEIKKLNKLKSNSLKVGQRLKIRTVEKRPVKKQEIIPAISDTSAINQPGTVQYRKLTAEELPDDYVYVVKRKDNLYRIALNHGLKTEDILRYNGFASDDEVISVGQKIIIKDPSAFASITGTPGSSQQVDSGINRSAPADSVIIEKVYIVQRKDSLFKIARENGITVEELKRINNLTSNRISTGQKLYIVAPSNGKTVTEKVQPSVSEEDLKTKSIIRTDLIMPAESKVLSEYGIRNGRPHKGIDLGAPNGMPVFAVLDGTIVYSGLQGNYGNVVVVEHPDFVMTVYAHNEKNLVSVGDIVKKGQIIATVGSTGNATASHVHFEYRIKGKAINPRKVLPLNK
jgi:LysM repeat protein